MATTHAYRFPDPVSPHLAARRASTKIRLEPLVAQAASLEATGRTLVVESAGGLFTPLTDEPLTNADLVAALRPDHVVLIAPNRLGVLHDVIATVTAGSSRGLRFVSIVLSQQQLADASQSSNRDELERLTRTPVFTWNAGAPLPEHLLELLRT
jgi:dethiobiotin synthetase